jgi:adenosylcobinamide kinase / adenosylcobinamide-phosphate guanylyltransferase
MRALILGGVRSGKTRYAEKLALKCAGPTSVVVTATAGDAEMAARIAAHRASRPQHWRVIEEPITLGRALREHGRPDGVVIVDCLTLWLTNLLEHADDAILQREIDALLSALRLAEGTVILISNEVGSGIVPVNELARRFTDITGSLHQRLAEICDRVLWMVAGLPVTVKE